MKLPHGFVFLPLAALLQFAPLPQAQAQDGPFDLVLVGGRVMDPESKLDAVRNVGITGGKIAAISEKLLKGKEKVDVSGLVVAPGLIDLHSHAMTLAGTRMQAFDGVTTSLELENGILPIGLAYAALAKEGRPINYGYSSSWSFARMMALAGFKSDGTLKKAAGAFNLLKWKFFATPDESRQVLDLIDQGLREGGVGVGVALGYGPDSNPDEYLEIARLAKKHGVPVFTHIRYLNPYGPKNTLIAHQEIIAVAAMTGAHMHICHLNSTASKRIPQMLEAVEKAATLGLKITFEGYPYGAGSTGLAAPFLAPDNLADMGLKPTDILYLKTGKRLADAEELAKLRKEDPAGTVLVYFLDETNPKERKLIDQVILHPDSVVASDGMIWQTNGKTLYDDVWPLPAGATAHPRSAGCFCRILGRYVREEKKLSLMAALRKCSLKPAQLLEASVPQMKNKGRVKVGADADIIVFDAKTVIDRATYLQPNQTSVGMHFVIVNGTPIIQAGELVKTALPGQAVRRPVQTK